MIFGLSPYFIIMNFYVFSIFGWIYESTFVSIRDRNLVNRGFLIGPMLPLYGTGATLVFILLRPFSGYASLLYASGMVIATVIEYITSWLLEKFFHAKWWDYSNEPYNFKGRIALIPSMFWGFLSLLLFDLLEPLATRIINLIPVEAGYYLMLVLILITVLDLSYTVITTINFRKQLENLYNFRTELENQLQDMQFSSIREIIASTSQTFSEKMDLVLQKLPSLKTAMNEDSRIASLEEHFNNYKEKHTSFTKRNPFLGNKRILNAFPTMKFIPKNKSSISVKELLNNLNILKNTNDKKDN